MNKTAISILEAIQESIHSPYEGRELSKEEKLEILDDLIWELKAEKNYIKSIDRIKKAKKQLAVH